MFSHVSRTYIFLLVVFSQCIIYFSYDSKRHCAFVKVQLQGSWKECLLFICSIQDCVYSTVKNYSVQYLVFSVFLFHFLFPQNVGKNWCSLCSDLCYCCFTELCESPVYSTSTIGYVDGFKHSQSFQLVGLLMKLLFRSDDNLIQYVITGLNDLCCN